MSHKATSHHLFLPVYLSILGFVALSLVCLLSPCRAFENFEDNARDHFDQGIKLYNGNKLDNALAEFQKAHELAPKEPTSLFWIGFIYLQERHYQEALQPTLDGLILRPKFADGHLNLGNIYDGLKRYPEAITEFQTAIQLEPNMPRLADAYYNLGNVYLKMGSKPEAVTAFQKAASLAPEDGYVQDQLGYAYQITGSFEKAVTPHLAATRIVPTNANFWLNLGLAQQGLAHKQANKNVPNGVALIAAREAFQHALKLAPEDFAVRESYGESLYEAKRYDEALIQFKKAVQINPKDYAPLFNMALAQTQLKHYDLAAEAYHEVFAIDPNNVSAQVGQLNCQGTLQFQRSQYAEATLTFQKLTNIKPENTAAWSNYSLALQKQGKYEEATSVLEEAFKHVGQGKEVDPLRVELANCYYRKETAENLSRARELYQQVTKNDPTSADAFNGLGLVAQKERKYNEAITNFKRATTLNPRFDDAYNNLGVAYEAKGDMVQAVANYRKALSVNPNNKLAKDNLVRLTTSTAAKK